MPQNNTNPQATTTIKKWPIIILLALILLVIASASVYLFRDKFFSQTNENNQISDTPVSEMTSDTTKLFLSLMYTGQNLDPVLSTYTTDVVADNGTLTRESFSSFSSNGVDPEVNSISFSPNGEWITFIAKSRIALEGEVSRSDNAYAFQVYRSKVVSGSMEETVNNAEQVTDIVAAYKSNPSINDDGEVLFNSLGIGTNEFNTNISPSPADWTVHHIDEQGMLTQFKSGLYPQWVGNDELLYVSDGGLIHSYINNPDQEENLMLTLPESLAEEAAYDFSDLSIKMTDNPGAIFDVSNDNNVLVLALPELKRTYSFRLTRGEGGGMSLSPIAMLNGPVTSWIQISPDNKSVGLLRYDPPTYVIYSLDTFDSSAEIFVGEFDIANLKITDWY